MDEEAVSHYYEMDPRTDDLVHANDLKAGMVVLKEWRLQGPDWWKTIFSVNLSPDNTVLSFIAIAPGGHKWTVPVNQAESWIVKLDSIPEKD